MAAALGRSTGGGSSAQLQHTAAAHSRAQPGLSARRGELKPQGGRGRDDVRVMMRYPNAERRTLGDLERIRLRSPGGHDVPFGEVATTTISRGYAVIKHHNRHRVITVTADVETTVANAESSLTTVTDLLPLLAERSFEAQFLIPMAISISFGLMGAMFLTLFLTPSLYPLLDDARRLLRWLALSLPTPVPRPDA